MRWAIYILLKLVSGQISGRPGNVERPKHPDNWGRPGDIMETKSRNDKEKEDIFKKYVKITHIPFTWPRKRQIKYISKQLNVPNSKLELTDQLVRKIERETRNIPIYATIPPLAGQHADEKPDWMPPGHFGGDRGPPGMLPMKKNGEELREYKDGKYANLDGLDQRPGAPGTQSTKRNSFDEEKWMAHYGYLPKKNKAKNSKPNVSHAEKKQAIKDVQYQYGLEETGILDAKLLEYMKKPRCGQADTPRSKSANLSGPSNYKINPGNHKWDNPTGLTYQVLGYTPDMPPELVDKTFKDAFHVWEKITNINFRKVSNDESADIVIYFGAYDHGDPYPFDGLNGLLAHAYYPDPGRPDLQGDMHFDESEFWTLGRGHLVRAVSGNTISGTHSYCQFPFWYDGIEYQSCAAIMNPENDAETSHLKWCSLTTNWENKWGFCGDATVYTYGGNAKNEMCHFPFKFQGKSYDKCTADGRADGYLWCSPDPDFETNSRYGFCPLESGSTFGGNGFGAPCVFPFIFEKNTYSGCTTQGRNDNLLWCATTSNYDDDKKFGFCQGNEYSLFHVAAHEAGHAIGLDHSNMESALMYPTYHIDDSFEVTFDRGLDEGYDLPRDDMLGAQHLYGVRDNSEGGGPDLDKPHNDAEWSSWSDFSSCSTSCGAGTKQRYRSCTSRQSKSICVGSSSEIVRCNEGACTTLRPETPKPTSKPTQKPNTPYEPESTTSMETATTENDGDSCGTVEAYLSPMCIRPFDAILQIEEDMYIFRDDKFWQISGKNHYSPAFVSQWKMRGPKETSTKWASLPNRIDAVYRLPAMKSRKSEWATGNTRFFSGQRVWEFKESTLVAGFPKDIRELGLPENLRFNAAVNRRIGRKAFRRYTHLFSGNRFYVYDEINKRLVGQTSGYTMNKSPIIGLPTMDRIIGATEANNDGQTYFFTDQYYYRVDDSTNRVNYVGLANDDFLHCCALENTQENEVVGSGVCHRTINYDDYRCSSDDGSNEKVDDSMLRKYEGKSSSDPSPMQARNSRGKRIRPQWNKDYYS